jgi:hypothetical protein
MTTYGRSLCDSRRVGSLIRWRGSVIIPTNAAIGAVYLLAHWTWLLLAIGGSARLWSYGWHIVFVYQSGYGRLDPGGRLTLRQNQIVVTILDHQELTWDDWTVLE